ncbi:MAG: acetolactate synthase small subunit, partial [Rhodobacter sp.]|nr:acetolactate synthase small subunit [Rhodobacter sp.]
MPPLNIKKGSSSHSAYDLRDPNAPVNETHTLAVLVDNES